MRTEGPPVPGGRVAGRRQSGRRSLRDDPQAAKRGFWRRRPTSGPCAISLLARDPALRQKMGSAGRQQVETDYSLSAWAETFVTSVTGGGRTAVRAILEGRSVHCLHWAAACRGHTPTG